MAVSNHLFYWCSMGFLEEEYCWAETRSYINIKAGIHEVPPVYLRRMFHTIHSEPRHKVKVSGQFHTPSPYSWSRQSC
jgi:hypothetical protein